MPGSTASRALWGLSVFRDLFPAPIHSRLVRVLDGQEEEAAPLAGLLLEEAERSPWLPDLPLWQGYLLLRLLTVPNLLAEKVTRTGPQGVGEALWQAATADLEQLQGLFGRSWEERADGGPLRLPARGLGVPVPAAAAGRIRRFLDGSPWGEQVRELADYFRTQGTGPFSLYEAFRWQEGRLAPVERVDRVNPQGLLGYEHQTRALVENTERFVASLPSNHVLLYGHRGTGKSSQVKALLPRFMNRGLRLIEVARDDLLDLPRLTAAIEHQPQRFLLLADDLAFEEGESAYKGLKPLLEGSVAAAPANLLIYATSNRRHLIRERFSDREGAMDDIHRLDTMQEKLALADRFGLTLFFPTPSQAQFLDIVVHLARLEGLPHDREFLEREAIAWAAQQNGRSGRTARQFIRTLQENPSGR